MDVCGADRLAAGIVSPYGDARRALRPGCHRRGLCRRDTRWSGLVMDGPARAPGDWLQQRTASRAGQRAGGLRLVQVKEMASQVRYRVPEPVRQFGLRKLAESDEADVANRRHQRLYAT